MSIAVFLERRLFYPSFNKFCEFDNKTLINMLFMFKKEAIPMVFFSLKIVF
jgi:hypothetical protein